MDVNKYRALFVEESREHVEATSRLLVELEKAEDRASFDAAFDEIFRHVHSMKGMAASMGYEPIANVAHRLEDVIASHRGRSVEKTTIDLLLRGVDALQDQIGRIADEEPLALHVELLQELRAAAAIDEDGEPPLAVPETADEEHRQAPGRLVSVTLDETTAAPQVRAFLVYRRLAGSVEIDQATPSLEDIKAGQLSGFTLRFKVRKPFDEGRCRSLLEGLTDVVRVGIEPLAGDTPPTPGSVEASPPPAPEAGEEAGAFKPTAAVPGGARPTATVRVRTDVLDGLIDSVGELFIVRERLRILLADGERPDVTAALDELSTRIKEIHDQVMEVRMMPLRTVTDRYPRLLRDLSQSLGKSVELDLRGGDIELDRAILDNLDSPFLHVLRNAVDHGVESPEERAGLGKPVAGKLVLSATRDRDAVLVTIADDGRGLDPEVLRELAVSRGLLSEAAAHNMDARESYSLICLPGFSTKSEVSGLSGRGVGMDVVRSNIEGLGGRLDIDSELGRGTRITLRLPLTLAIIPVLLIEVAGRTFALPAAGVVAIREPTGEDIFPQATGGLYLSFQHALVRVWHLGALLKLREEIPVRNVVVLEDGRDLCSLAVDRIVGYQEVVVKPLGDPLDRIPWFSGATVLGDGRPILILDMPKALRGRAAA